MPELYGRISDAVVSGNIEEIGKITQQALDKGLHAKEILEKGLLPGMDIVGQRFKVCEMFIPEVLRSAKTMHASMDILKPFLSGSGAAGSRRVIIGTVEGDLHDIGKNLVGMMLEGAGFQVIDLGANVAAQGFVDAIQQQRADILGMSALLTTTMPKMKETMDVLQEAGIRKQIKVMVGGAPVTQDFANKIGADGYSSNAGGAVEIAKKLSKK